MVKMLRPRRMTYATVSSPFVVTTLLSCYYCNMLSGIVLEIARPEALYGSGCFDSHINIIYLAGCVLFTSTCSSHSVLLCGGKG